LIPGSPKGGGFLWKPDIGLISEGLVRQALTSLDENLYVQYTTLKEGLLLEFSWDEAKNNKNFAKHGIWFEEAGTVFADANALELFDEAHSEDEERFILLGLSTLPRLLIVVYCERDGKTVRLISARKATKKEARDYEERI